MPAVNSFPAFRVTGPVHHYIRYPGYSSIYYLGTCTVKPVVRWEQQKIPFMNDVAGRSIPAQFKDDGETATIAATLNRFSQSALNFAEVLAAGGGRQGRFSRGKPILGLKSFNLWQVFENYLDAGTRALYPDLPIGYYWPQVVWAALEDSPGNSDQEKHCAWECYPYFTPQSNPAAVAAGEREWVLYSTDVGDFPADVLVPQ